MVYALLHYIYIQSCTCIVQVILCPSVRPFVRPSFRPLLLLLLPLLLLISLLAEFSFHLSGRVHVPSGDSAAFPNMIILNRANAFLTCEY